MLLDPQVALVADVKRGRSHAVAPQLSLSHLFTVVLELSGLIGAPPQTLHE